MQRSFCHRRSQGTEPRALCSHLLRDRALFRWQQHKRKLDGETAVPITWEEFEAFLRRSLGESRAFVDGIWKSIRRNSQYQSEEVMDWAAHLEHLQTVLKEFDPVAAPNEEVLIRYFRDGLRPSIRAQVDEHGRDLDIWEEAIEKAIDAEAKADRQPQCLMRDMDNRCPRGHRPAKTDEPTIRASKSKDTTRDSDSEEEPRPSQSVYQSSHFSSQLRFSRSEKADTSDKRSRKEKKEQYRRDQAWSRNSNTPVTNVNATGAGKVRKNLDHITCFNCNEKVINVPSPKPMPKTV